MYKCLYIQTFYPKPPCVFADHCVFIVTDYWHEIFCAPFHVLPLGYELCFILPDESKYILNTLVVFLGGHIGVLFNLLLIFVPPFLQVLRMAHLVSHPTPFYSHKSPKRWARLRENNWSEITEASSRKNVNLDPGPLWSATPSLFL